MMKTLKLLFVCALLFGFAINTNAQSESERFDRGWKILVECDGVTDVIIGPVNFHRVMHFNTKTNLLEWVKINFRGDVLVSQNTGEKFSVNFTRKIDVGETENVYITRFNLKGDKGSHILVTKYWLFDKVTVEWTETDDTKCL